MSDYNELIERLDGYKSKWMGSALISDAAAALRELRLERGALRLELEEWKATALLATHVVEQLEALKEQKDE